MPSLRLLILVMWASQTERSQARTAKKFTP